MSIARSASLRDSIEPDSDRPPPRRGASPSAASPAPLPRLARLFGARHHVANAGERRDQRLELGRDA
jgi:hypothetical protein